jgi:YjbE family integral membrane protein
MDFTSGAFWASLGSIVLANIVLSGDNAVVIALAARSLPARQQGQAIFFGSAAAIVLRITLTLLAVEMLRWPYLKVIGAVLLLYVGISLLSEDDGKKAGPKAPGSIGAAIRTILVADLVMSLDNVIAVAAAAGDSYVLLILGLAISIPLVIFGATLLLKLMERWPIIITIGAGLLGFVAGEMAWEDGAIAGFTKQFPEWIKYAVAGAGAVFVVGMGRILAHRSLQSAAEEQRDHLEEVEHGTPHAAKPAKAPDSVR